MPTYVYKLLNQENTIVEFIQSIHDDAFTHHPESGEPMQRIIQTAAPYHRKGIKKSTKVNKLSPAATACGCASQTVLKSLGMEKTTPRYGEAPKVARPSGHGHGSAGHSHSHDSSGCGHKH